MRYCTNCGNELHGEKFCTKCGTKTGIDVAPEVVTPLPVKKEKKFIGKLIMVLALLGISITAFMLLTSRSYEALVKDYVKATMNGDAEKIVSLMPDSLVDYIAEKEYEGDKKEMIFDLEDELDGMVEQLEDYGVDLKTISYEILEVEEMDEDEIDDLCDEYRRAELKIKEGKELKVELKIPMDGQERTNSIYIDVVKIGRSWYLIGM